MSKGGYYKHFGFLLPTWVTIDPPGFDPTRPPRDRVPVAGLCFLCKRESPNTYVRWDGNRVCITDIKATVDNLEKRRRWTFGRRTIPDRPWEPEPSLPWVGPERDWWERQFA